MYWSRPGCNEIGSRTVLHYDGPAAVPGTSRARVGLTAEHPTLLPGAYMFAVIRRYNTHEGAAEKIVQRVREGFVPLISRLPGFVSYDVVRSTDGSFVSVSVFTTREAADDSSRMASDWVHDNLATLIRTAPVILSGEVMVHHATAPSAPAVPAPRARIIPDRMSESRAPLS